MFENIIYFIATTIIISIVVVFYYYYITIPSRNDQLQVFLKKAEYDKAEILILDVIKKEPSNIEMLVTLSDIYWITEKKEQAVKIFENIITMPKLSPVYANIVLFRLASWYTEKNYLVEASETLEKLLLLDPKNTQNLTLLGDIYYKKKEFDKSIATYKKVIALNVNDLQAWKELAYIYFFLKMYTEAYQAFSQLIKLDQINPEYVFKLAEMCMILNDFDKALTYFEQINKFNDPLFIFKATKKIAYIYQQQQDYDQYVLALEKARFLITGNSNLQIEQEEILDTYYQLGEFYSSHNHIHLALKEWEKILQINKNYRDTAAKFEKFYTSQLNDFFTDMLTHKDDELVKIISNFIISIGYNIDSIQSFGTEAFDFFVSESSAKWRDIRRRKTLISFWCSNRSLPVDIPIRLGTASNSKGLANIFIISTGPVFSEERINLSKKSIVVYDQNNIQELMNARKKILTNN